MKSVLVVDDSKFMRAVVSGELRGAGYTIAGEAECSQEAVEKYKALKPDIVTMDITMTIDGVTLGRSSNGIDAIKEIREFDPDAKILVVSAMGQKCYVIEAIEAGAKDFVVKPFDQMRLIEAIKKFD